MYEHFVNEYNAIFPFDEDLKTSLIPYIKPKGRCVDLGCGTGRLVHLLDQLGMNATGVDVDGAMIEYAKRAFPHLSFIHTSMIDYLKDQSNIDVMTCFGNTLPHINHQELILFFKHVKQSLAPKGYLLVQMLNYIPILKKKPPMLKPILFNKGSFIREYEYYHDRIIFKTTLTIGSTMTSDQTTLYPYVKDELIDIIAQQGLHAEGWNDFDGSVWKEDSDGLSLVITHA